MNWNVVSNMETKANIVEKMFRWILEWKSHITSATPVGMDCVQELIVYFFGCYMVLDEKCLRDAVSSLRFCMSKNFSSPIKPKIFPSSNKLTKTR